MQSLSEREFESFIRAAAHPVLVDFWAPWCRPCMLLAQPLGELAAELAPSIEFVKINVDENQALAVAFLIQTQQILPVTLLGIGLAPEFIFQKRRKAARPDSILPNEPVLEKRAAG